MNITFHSLITREDNTFLLNSKRIPNLIKIDNHNESVLHGRLKAIQQSDDFISFIDDDDETLFTTMHLEDISKLNFDCLFTNSILNNSTHLNNSSIQKWTSEYENRGLILPHQTFIFRKEIYRQLTNEAIGLIDSKQWSENMFDFVIRLLCSKYNLWTYYPQVTYKWNTSRDSISKTFERDEFARIRRFIKGN